MTEQELTDGTLALSARRITLEPGEPGRRLEAPPGEAFLYVIAGSGRVRAAGESAALAIESVIWLEPGDACVLEPGDGGLELLLAVAPEGE
jgi:quercetin dioxygenase-like cupin family protein